MPAHRVWSIWKSISTVAAVAPGGALAHLAAPPFEGDGARSPLVAMMPGRRPEQGYPRRRAEDHVIWTRTES